MPLSLQKNEILRQRLWHSFRESLREHPTPLVDSNRMLRRIVIGAAREVLDVQEGMIAELAVSAVPSPAPRRISEPLTQTVTWAYINNGLNGTPANPLEERVVIASVPFTGRLVEYGITNVPPSVEGTSIAIVFDSSGSLFRSSFDSQDPDLRFADLRPGFLPMPFFDSGGFSRSQFRSVRTHMVVLGGEQVRIILRTQDIIASSDVRVIGYFVFSSDEAIVFAPEFVPPSTRVRQSASEVLRSQDIPVESPPVGPRIIRRKATLFPTWTCPDEELLKLDFSLFAIRPGIAQSLTGVEVLAGDPLPDPPEFPSPVCLFRGWEGRIRGARVSPVTPMIVQDVVQFVPPSPPPRRVVERKLPGEGLMFVPAGYTTLNMIGSLIPVPRRNQKITISGMFWTRVPAVGDEDPTGQVEIVPRGGSIPEGAVIGRIGPIQYSPEVREEVGAIARATAEYEARRKAEAGQK